MKSENYIRQRLLELSDEKYRDFHASLCPTLEKELIIGVRKPALRKLSKELWKQNAGREFIKILPHKYCEENDLHGMLIEQMTDFEALTAELDRFLPFVDNWATCDLISPKIFKNRPKGLEGKAEEWMMSDKTYTCRFGIEVFMKYFLDEGFKDEYPDKISKIRSDEYYIKMMVAWYFATALAKQWDRTVGFIEQKKLDAWTHNKAIQKSVESHRITDRRKEYLKTLKIKNHGNSF